MRSAERYIRRPFSRKSPDFKPGYKTMKTKGGMACRYHMKSTLRLEKEAERDGAEIRVYLPIPVEYAQVKNFKLLSVTIETEGVKREAEPGEYTVSAPDYPQRTVCFHTVHHTGQTYSIEFSYENHMRYVEPKEEEVLDGQPSMYLGEQLPHIQFTPYLREIAAEVVGDETNPLKKARKIYNYLTSHIMYSFVRTYITIPQIPELCGNRLERRLRISGASVYYHVPDSRSSCQMAVRTLYASKFCWKP